MSNDKTVQLKVTLGIGLEGEQGDVIDTGIPVTEWDAMTEEERQERGQVEWREWIWEHIDGGWDVVSP